MAALLNLRLLTPASLQRSLSTAASTHQLCRRYRVVLGTSEYKPLRSLSPVPSTPSVSLRRSLSGTRSTKNDKNESKSADPEPGTDVPRRIVVKRNGEEENIDLANIKDRVGSLIPKKARQYQRSILIKRARVSGKERGQSRSSSQILSSSKKSSNDFTEPPACFLIPGTMPSTSSESEGGALPTSRLGKKDDKGTAGSAESPVSSVVDSQILLPKSRIRLPVVNASALLDKQSYCVQSASASTSRSGTEAAMRLHKGQQDLVAVIRGEILSQPVTGRGTIRSRALPSSSSTVHPPPYYVLQGHGVPPQLLQAHIDFADLLLRKCAATEISFSNSALKVDWVRKRRATDNTNHVVAWSSVASLRNHTPGIGGGGLGDNEASGSDGPGDFLTHDMELYLTVMDRIAKALGLILPPSKPRHLDARREPPTSLVDEYDNEWTETSTSPTALSSFPALGGDSSTQNAACGAALKHWHAEFLRGRSVPPEWFPTSEFSSKRPQPLVEWTPLTGMAAPGRVTIRLQGYPSASLASSSNVAATTTSSKTTVAEDGTTTTITRSKPVRRRRAQPISLVFDACFRHL